MCYKSKFIFNHINVNKCEKLYGLKSHLKYKWKKTVNFPIMRTQLNVTVQIFIQNKSNKKKKSLPTSVFTCLVWEYISCINTLVNRI